MANKCQSKAPKAYDFKFNENQAIYESQGAVFVNPNNFIRVKMVLEEILRLTKTDVKHNTLVKIEDDGTVTVKVLEVHNMRTWVVVTLDGLPHKIAIDVIKHCYKCELCGKEITVNSDVVKHMQDTGHRIFWEKLQAQKLHSRPSRKRIFFTG